MFKQCHIVKKIFFVSKASYSLDNGCRFKYFNYFTESADNDLQNIADLKTITVNCSVAYMSGCMSMRKW